jgi:hypothetical protein
MIDERERYERAFRVFDMPDPAFERMLERDQRRRRSQRLAAGALGIAVAVGAILVARGLTVSLPDDVGTTPTPAPEGRARFDSPSYGYSIVYPSDWTVEPATVPWAWGEDVSETGRADWFVRPGEGGVLGIASTEIAASMTEEEWVDDALRQRATAEGAACDRAPGIQPLEIDGVPGVIAPACSTAAVATRGRGYLIILYGDLRADRGLYDDVLASMDLRPAAGVDVPMQSAWPGIWPFSSRAEAAEAQDGADGDDRTFTWLLGEGDQSQYGEGDVVAKRFVNEQLGWASFRVVDGGWSGSVANLRFIRCEPGRANATYPDVECAPREGDRFETIVVRMEQPFRTGPSGIWVITRWEPVPAFEQTVPPTEEQVRSLVTRFMEARMAGSGAEPFLVDPSAVSLLYRTTGGDPFVSYSIGSIAGPDWPGGEFQVRIRLSAEDAEVRQTLSLRRTDEGLRIGNSGYTTEDGEVVW